MKRALLLFLSALTAHGELSAPVASPKGEYSVVNVGEGKEGAFQIRDRSGQAVFTATPATLPGAVSLTALSALWSPDGRSVAIGVRMGKYIEDTFVFSLSNGAFVRIPLGALEADSKVIPVRWASSRELIVAISGVYGGKADHPIFTRRCTFRLRPEQSAFEKVYESSRTAR